jgi:hypothetical protein
MILARHHPRGRMGRPPARVRPGLSRAGQRLPEPHLRGPHVVDLWRYPRDNAMFPGSMPVVTGNPDASVDVAFLSGGLLPHACGCDAAPEGCVLDSPAIMTRTSASR